MFESTKYTKEEFIKAVEGSLSIMETLRKLGLKPTGANYTLFRRRVKMLNICTNHFLGRARNSGPTHSGGPERTPLNDILVENSTYTNTTCLKKYLIGASILEYRCYMCGLIYWNGKRLSLVLDHVNGDHFDNRKENLRLLCPNCNSQTSTFCGKNDAPKTI